MKEAGEAGRSERGTGSRGARPRPAGMRVAYLAIAVLSLALGACTARFSAPVESRVDDAVPKTVAGDASAQTDDAPAPAVPVPTAAVAAATLPEESTARTEVPATPAAVPAVPAAPPAVPSAPAKADLPTPEVPGVPEVSAGAAPAASKRLAALNPAIVSLLNDTHRLSAAGRHDGAATTLERALQIEPEDAGLWHRLARVRLDQGKADLTEALAAKSNSLAADDPNLQSQNWLLIAKARARLGDAAGAADARAQAARLLR